MISFHYVKCTHPRNNKSDILIERIFCKLFIRTAYLNFKLRAKYGLLVHMYLLLDFIPRVTFHCILM